ncbi:MAG TPA: hypothetical protein VGY66_10625 [Gemmataceae bacterium]|nr:hypothetical protein [Gemmataceae bacterium]
MTDAGLKELAGLKNLQTLELAGTAVTDTGLKELAGLKSLQRLNLTYTRVTDKGLKELAGHMPSRRSASNCRRRLARSSERRSRIACKTCSLRSRNWRKRSAASSG